MTSMVSNKLQSDNGYSAMWLFRISRNTCIDYTRRFIKESFVQHGSTCTVSTAIDSTTEEVVAIKKAKLSSFFLVARECAIVQSLGSHPHIAKVHEGFVDYLHQRAGLVMEYCNGVDLIDIVGSTENGLPISDFIKYASQLASALTHIHSRGICHRDIKADNVCTVVDNGACKIVDFGAACHVSEPITVLSSGTLEYLAPELVAPIEIYNSRLNVLNLKYDLTKCDVFALGVTFFSMITAKFPFKCASMRDPRFFTFVTQQQLGKRKTWETIPGPLKVLLISMCHVDPNQRWNMEKVEKYLQFLALVFEV
eukprot:CFRG6333T1